MQKIMKKLIENFEEYAKENGLVDTSKLEEYLMEYLQSEEAKTIISNNLTKIIQSQNLEKQISNIMNDYMKTATSSISKSLEKEITKSMNNLSKSMSKAISIDEKSFCRCL